MTFLIDPPGSLRFLPLTVAVDGKKYALRPVFEPMYSPAGPLMALEMLSRLRLLSDPQVTLDPSRFFAWASADEAWRVFAWQIDVLTRCRPWFAGHSVPVSLNINRAQARGCLMRMHDGVLDRLDALAPWLRLEISEHFLRADTDARDDPLLTLLAGTCPLWLDDFGAGSANLVALFSGRFDVIKLDRAVVSTLACTPPGLDLLNALLRLAREQGAHTVLEGVATPDDLARVRGCGAWALQGWLWPPVSLNAFDDLCLTDPVLTAASHDAHVST